MAQAASEVNDLHAAVKRGDLPAMRRLLERKPALANARSHADVRGPFPLHVAAEAGQTGAARLLLEYGADVSARDLENDAIALGWAAFFGRPELVQILIAAGSDAQQRNRHGLTPLDCALGGAQGKWRKFSDATLEDWREAANLLSKAGPST